MEKKELTTEEWRAEKKKKKAQMAAMQALPYEVKVKRAEIRAFEFIEKLDEMGLNAHVSVGGLDSIVLLQFLRKIGIDIPAISVSALEDKHTENTQGVRGYSCSDREAESADPKRIWISCDIEKDCRKN